MSLNEFLAMGGYAFYVWGAYGLTLIVLVLNIVLPLLEHRQFLYKQAAKQRRSNL
jgi:heme exporter protein D